MSADENDPTTPTGAKDPANQEMLRYPSLICKNCKENSLVCISLLGKPCSSCQRLDLRCEATPVKPRAEAMGFVEAESSYQEFLKNIHTYEKEEGGSKDREQGIKDATTDGELADVRAQGDVVDSRHRDEGKDVSESGDKLVGSKMSIGRFLN